MHFRSKSDDHLTEITSEENKHINLIDLYYPSYGRCDALDEALRALYMGIEDPDEKIMFLHADLTKFPNLLGDPDAKPTAKPHFKIYFVNLYNKVER